MSHQPTTVADLQDFTVLIDARSPAEYALDHLPGAINCPVLDDEEAGRAVVELLADLLADADARPAATGTRLVRLGQVVLDPLARQLLWQ